MTAIRAVLVWSCAVSLAIAIIMNYEPFFRRLLESMQ